MDRKEYVWYINSIDRQIQQARQINNTSVVVYFKCDYDWQLESLDKLCEEICERYIKKGFNVKESQIPYYLKVSDEFVKTIRISWDKILIDWRD